MNICVFGASSDIIEDKYIDTAYQLGCEMAKRNIGLVFGGGNCGVMGASARGEYDNGGYILGVAPHFMKIHNLLFDNNGGKKNLYGGSCGCFHNRTRRHRNV